MRSISLFFALLCFAQISVALEFDSRLAIEGEGYVEPVGRFFEETNDSLGLVAARDDLAFRYVLSSNGRVQRLPLTTRFRYLSVGSTSLGDDLIEWTEENVPIFTGQVNYGEIRRYRADGTLKFARQVLAGFGNAPAVKADGQGGFWIAKTGLLHVDAVGNLRQISRTGGGKSYFTTDHLVEYGSRGIFRTPVSLTPVAPQNTGMPQNRSLQCLIDNGAQGMLGLATSYDEANFRYGIYRLVFSPDGTLQSNEAFLSEITSFPEILCTRNRVALATSYREPSENPREIIMLDPNLAIQYRARIPSSIVLRLSAIGPNGEALIQDRESSLQPFGRAQRYSARGELTTLRNSSYVSRASYDSQGALYLTRRLELTNGARLQVTQFASDNPSETPTRIFDLPAPIGAPKALAFAVENSQVQLLIKNPEIPYAQHISIDETGSAQLKFERTDPILQAQRFANGWLTQSNHRAASPALQLLSDTGNTIFSTPIVSSLLACEVDGCDFLGSSGGGQIDRYGVVTGLSATILAGRSLHSAPGQRASIRVNNQISRLVDNQLVNGQNVGLSDSEIVQNSDATHWIAEPGRAVFADFVGNPLSIYNCPQNVICRVLLDQIARRVFVLTSPDESRRIDVRELNRAGELGTGLQLVLPSDVVGYFIHAVSSAGSSIWVRATIYRQDAPPIESLYAIDANTRLQQLWALEPSSVVQRSASGFALQLALNDRSFTTVESVSISTGAQLSVRRFEFNPIVGSFADGFE